MHRKVVLRKNRYADSVSLMSVSDKVRNSEGIINAEVAMATPANREVLEGLGFEMPAGTGRNDQVIAISADTEVQVDMAVKLAEDILDHKVGAEAEPGVAAGQGAAEGVTEYNDIDEIDLKSTAYDLVQISLPGEYAFAEAEKAIKKGLDVFIFSDNVPIEDEVKLKKLGNEKGVLVMGPDCGVGLMGGIALAAGSIIRKGSIGIAGASGSGAQEVACIIEKCGCGVSSIIGTGGRDLLPQVGGMSMIAGMKKLNSDPGTEAIVLVSKLADRAVMEKVLTEADGLSKPVVAVFLGGDRKLFDGHKVKGTLSLEEAALEAVSIITGGKPVFGFSDKEIDLIAASEARRFGTTQKYLRGIYCGGTFTEESMIYLREHDNGLRLFSNLKTSYADKLESHLVSREHTILDLGAEDFTHDSPHPVFDPAIRFKRFIKEIEDPETAVVVLDFITGPGVHEDPVTPFAEAIRKAMSDRRGAISFVTAICGSEGDPQDVASKEKLLAEAGAVVAGSNYQSARIAAAILDEMKKNNIEGKGLVEAVYSKFKIYERKVANPPGDGLKTREPAKLRVINIGLKNFYDALIRQGAGALQINWRPPVRQSAAIADLLDSYL